jgi:4-hydroxy-tetrahydrodipicolinate reductase
MSETITTTGAESGIRERRLPTPLILAGLGPVGAAVLRAAQDDPRLEVAGCVDPRRDREQLAREQGFEGAVYADIADVPSGHGVAVVCTSSKLADIAPTALRAVQRGYDVVSTCEQLIAPRLAPEDVVAQLHAAATEADRTIVGCGVNPGFVMDVLPVMMTLATRDVTEVRVFRSVDVSRRRSRLQDKVGLGLSSAEFAQRKQGGGIGHVGLRESLAFIADALGWAGDAHEDVEPILDDLGDTALGVRHTGEVTDAEGRVRVSGLLEMYSGADNRDRIEIYGQPTLQAEFPTGVSGDTATVSAALNVAGAAGQAPAGLVSLAELLPLRWTT